MRHILLGLVGVLVPFLGFADAWLSAEPQGVGQPATLRATGLFPSEAVTVDVTKPDGTLLSFGAEATPAGDVLTNVFGLHLEQSGGYEVALFRETGEVVTDGFTLPAGPVSAYRSVITAAKDTAPADGRTAVSVLVRAIDAYGNAVPDATLRIISSRENDEIVAPPRTDLRGEAQVSVMSDAPGVSVLSAVVGNTVLSARQEVVFYIADGTPNAGSPDDAGLGAFLQAQLFGDDLSSPEVAYLRLEGMDTEVALGDAQNVTVSARDINGEVVTDYTGTVRFSSSDAAATLPQDYQFTEEDQGNHTFFLAVNFGTAGEQTLAASDLDDFRIFGQWEGRVVDLDSVGVGSSTSTATSDGSNPGSGQEIQILTPIEGTYKSNRMTITGFARNCETVRLRDGNQVLTEGLFVDTDNSFVFQTPRLADGLHQFQAVCEQGDALSNIVPIRIDRTPPAAMSVEIQPQNPMAPGQPFTILLGSSEPLSGGRCVFRDVPTEHTEGQAEKWNGQYTAPLQPGEYPVACSVFDLSSNELHEPNAGVIIVVDGAGTGTATDAGQTPITIRRTDNMPKGDDDSDGDGVLNRDEWKDTNENGIPDAYENAPTGQDTDFDGLTDAEEAVCGTDPADADSNDDFLPDGVMKYYPNALQDEILFLSSLLSVPAPLSMNRANDTDLDGVPDWLEAGTDKLNPRNDSDGDGLSNIEDGVPLRPLVNGGVCGVAEVPPATSNGGKCTMPPNLRTEPYPGDDTKLWLVWDAATCPAGVNRYQIDFGTDVRLLTMQNVTPDARTRWYIEGLVACQSYSFQARALANDGEVGPANMTEGTPGTCRAPEPVYPPDLPDSGQSTDVPGRGYAWFFGILSAMGLFLLLRKRTV